MPAWSVILRPEGGRDATGENTGGLVVLVAQTVADDYEVEVGRVAFNRKVARQPRKKFDTVLREVIEKAQTACDALNDHMDTFDRERAEEFMKTRDRIREILGPKPDQAE